MAVESLPRAECFLLERRIFDDKFHAFDKSNGKLLWETILPAREAQHRLFTRLGKGVRGRCRRRHPQQEGKAQHKLYCLLASEVMRPRNMRSRYMVAGE